MKACIVVGGGIIGLSTAYYLLKEGHQVTVIDKGKMDSGASYVNAGFVSPSHFIPLAAPGVIGQGLKWMLDKRSPFYINPRLDVDLVRWVLQFKRSSTQKRVEKSIPVLKDFTLMSRELFKEMHQSGDFKFDFDQNGILMLYKTEAGGEKEIKIGKRAVEEGYKLAFLDREEVKEKEPDVALDVLGAVYYDSDAHMTPNRFMPQLKAYLEQQGVRMISEETVVDMDVSRQRIQAVKTRKATYKADEIILTSGVWTPELVKKLGLKMLLQAGKGYKIDVLQPTGIRLPSILVETKIGATPMTGFTRFAGTMEIAGINSKMSWNRVRAIADAVPQYFPDIRIEQQTIEKAAYGLRPLTPDGIPYIGRTEKFSNVIVSAGHAMLGWTLGPATGKLIAEMVSGKKTSLDMTPFSLNRFD